MQPRVMVILQKLFPKIHLKDKESLYTPSNGQNLLSVAKLKEAGASFHFAERDEIVTKDGTIFALEPRNNMFVWRTVTNTTIDMDSNHCNQEEQCFASSLKVWHERLGHTNYNDLKRLSEHVEGMKISNKDEGICGCCETNKSKRRPVPKDTITRATEVLEIVHTDVLGPIANESPESFKYAIGFVDSFSRFIKVCFMRSRDEVLEKFQQFCSDIGNPRMVVSDGAKEFTSSEFRSFCRKRGIRHETSAPYTPEENGKIERVWGTVVGMTRCMLDNARLGKQYWPYALNYAFYVKNFCLHSAIGMTPYERMYGVKPNIEFLRTFGCTSYIFIEKQFRKKLDKTAEVGVFLGFSVNSKTYIVGIPKTDGSLRIMKSRNVKFEEEKMFMKQHAIYGPSSSNNQDYTENQISSHDIQPNPISTNDNNTNSHVSRIHRKSTIDEQFSFVAEVEDTLILNEEVPKSVNEALMEPSWVKAMEDELQSLKGNKVWDLVELPDGKNSIGSRWHFTVKFGPNGKPSRHKARFVAKGFSQREGIDYKETYSPIARLSTVRVVMNIAAQNSWQIKQLDIKTANLNANVDADISMKQPEGFEEKGPNGEKLVCKLNKSLYGPKQSGRNWYYTLKAFLEKIGFVVCMHDSCLFVRHVNDCVNAVVCVCVG